METNIGAYVDRCAHDAYRRFGDVEGAMQPCTQDLALYAFPQTWGNTAGGMGGIGGQMMTTQTTVVIVDHLNDRAVIYFGRFAYMVDHPSEEFWEALTRHKMPGKGEGHGKLSRKSI